MHSSTGAGRAGGGRLRAARDDLLADPLRALAVAAVALGMALLLPRLFSDPVGVDPYSLRLAGVAASLAAISLARPAFLAARGALLGVAAIVVPFALWAATPHLLLRTLHLPLSFVAALAVAGAAQLLITLLIAMVARRLLPSGQRPWLRLTGCGSGAVLTTLAGAAAFIALFLLAPAVPLGRLAVQPLALHRDLLWLIPACSLQAAAQELGFRGLLLGALERGTTPNFANLAQALLFGLSHIAVQYEGPAAAFVPVTVGLGLLFGVVTQRTRSLWPAILVHALADVAVAVAIVPGLYGL
ncbi:MAG: lysostaphin resistance A-like protein [Candidatus Dormibacteria bacterium]